MSPIDWATEKFCHVGDSAEALKEKIPDNLKVKLFLTDPPYNLGFDYGDVDDSLSIDEYHRMLRGVFEAAYDAADDDAHLFIINYPEIIGRMWDDVIAPTTKGGTPRKRPYWEFNQWITWCYPNNWPPVKSRFTRASRAIIWMKKGNPTQNIKQIVQPYKNPWDRRVKKLMEEGNLGPALYDWWPQIDLCKNVSTDKVVDPPYSNQIPEFLLRRIIHITTSPGDLVADPFAGTFSTVKAALHTSRLGWGCDLNPETEVYHPDHDEYDDSYETVHSMISDKQMVDIDWREEPFDFERAGISSSAFYNALAKGAEELPKKQRFLLIDEIKRLTEYSKRSNINEAPDMQSDPRLDDTQDVIRSLLVRIPLNVLREILDLHELEYSPNAHRSSLVNLVHGVIFNPNELNSKEEGLTENESQSQ